VVIVRQQAILDNPLCIADDGTHACALGLAQLLTDGSKLSAAEAQQIEQQLLRDPEDLAGRAKLVSY